MKFISKHEGKKNFENLKLLLNIERKYPGIFINVMTNCDEIKSFRECLDENGKPIRISWEEASKKFYLNNKYVGVTKENADIAETFGRKGLSQKIFNKASELRNEAKKLNVPEHILGAELKEETILEAISRIKTQAAEELISGRQMIEELHDKQFTYEWLNKNDPHNSIIGLFCSCCATINSEHYGDNIVRASAIAPDTQNLVVRNSKGEIISKGTVYVNKKSGYAVINDFELNERYRNHEIENSSGRYYVEKTSKEEIERDMIFKAFQRGLQAFIKKYNKQNPNKPLTQINVGMGYNRLKRQVEQFKKATSNLTVPSEYNFKDAMNEQFILYQRVDKQTENERQER